LEEEYRNGGCIIMDSTYTNTTVLHCEKCKKAINSKYIRTVNTPNGVRYLHPSCDDNYMENTEMTMPPNVDSVGNITTYTGSANVKYTIIEQNMTADLKRKYPHGHPDFIDITMQELDLHDKKNMDYAGSTESAIAAGLTIKPVDPMGNFNRVSSILSHYPNLKLSNPIVVALVYMFKQLDCILWALSNNVDTRVDTLDERFADVHVYAKLARCMWRDFQKKHKK
jgi:hypothetical protein